jgi:hypothetical protein
VGTTVLVALVVGGAACTAGDDGAGDEPSTASPDSPASTDGVEVDAPIPDDAVWVLGDDSLTFARVDEREVPIRAGTPAGVAYRRADGVTARIVEEPDDLGAGDDGAGGQAEVLPSDGGGAMALVRLGGTARATVTIAGASSPETAADAAAEVADLLVGGVDLGFDSHVEPVARLGDFRLVGRFDAGSPVVETTSTLLEYRRADGGAVRVEQAELVDPGAPLEVAILGSTAPIEVDDGLRVAVTEGAIGFEPMLTTIVGTTRVVINAPEDDLRRLAHLLEPVERAAVDEMVREVSEGVVERGEGEPVVDGVTWYANGNEPPLACIDGEEPDSCVEVTYSLPLMMAPLPRGDAYLVVGCVDPRFPVTGVVVDDRPIPTQTSTASCGQAFSAPDVAPGTLTIAFDDGPGGVGTYTYDLP